MRKDRIAIIGIGLSYPDANSAAELWENVLAGRSGSRPARQRTNAMDTAARALSDAGFRDGPPSTGEYIVDGSGSSLRAIAAAADALAGGKLDVAVAGAGAGVVVLMRESDVLAGNRRSYASITGWDARGGPVSYVEDDGTAAGLIKVALAVYHQVIPPAAGRRPELFPAHLPIRAAVSGGDTHIELEQAPGRQRRTGLSRRTQELFAGRQDAELLLFGAPGAAGLRARIARAAALVPGCAELADLAATLAAVLPNGSPFRAAVVAANREEATRKLGRLLAELDAGRHDVFDAAEGVFLAHGTRAARIAYLFPGEGPGTGGAIRHRFPIADTLFRMAGPADQARTVAGSLAGLRVLHNLGIDADIAAGHGLGELTARAWAGAVDGSAVLRLAAGRGAGDPAEFGFRPARRTIASTMTDAVAGADLVLEIGPGRALCDRLAGIAPQALAVDTGSASLVPVLAATGAAFTLGAAVDAPLLFADRAVRPVDLSDADESAELPLSRFIDRVLAHHPGVELITEVELSAGSDPYLADQHLGGELLFPAAVAMEAMAQVAAAVSGRSGAPLLDGVELPRPIVVRPGHTTTIRLAARVRDGGAVEVSIRSEETGFGTDHIRATLRYPRPALPAAAPSAAAALPPIAADPVTEFYGGAMFQGKRFQKLPAYRRAGARHAVAELSTVSSAAWFAPFLPQDRLLADPGTRDAVMHSIQACVPDATLLPDRIERLYLAQVSDQDTDFVVIDARERCRDGDGYTYDVDVLDPAGRLVERWEGLTLRAVRTRPGAGPWAPCLIGSYLERSLERLLGGDRSVVVEPDPVDAPVDRRAQTDLAAGRALGRPTRVRHRGDGRPDIDGGAVSVSHGAGLTLVVTGTGRLGCAVQTVRERDRQDWVDLLGGQQIPVRDRLVAETGERAAVAGTRIWAALKCLYKAGSTSQSLTLDRIEPEGWVVLSTGGARVATWVTTVNKLPEPVVFAVLWGEES